MKKKKILLTLGMVGCSILMLTACGNEESNVNNDLPTNQQGEYINYVKEDCKTYYVAADGKKDNAGTSESPLDLVSCLKKVAPGDTVLLKDGNYKFAERIRVGILDDLDSEAKINGAPNYPITVKPEIEGTNVTLDFSAMTTNDSNRGVQIYGNYWTFKNIDICGAGDNGMYIAGSHNVVENCNFYNNKDTGLQIGRGFNSQAKIEDWPAYNLVKNCTSFANYDDESFGENADGFAAKLTIGYGNVFDGCVAFRNSDDGWDLFAKADSGNIGTVILYNCVSFENGFLPYKIPSVTDPTVKTYNTRDGDGIGFKLGGSTMEGDVILNNCLSFNNKLHGVGDNSNPGCISANYVTAVNNCIGLDENGDVSSVRGNGLLNPSSNNIALARSIKSYNNFYGVVSYVSNQKDFTPTGDATYNRDEYRGSAAYSIFQRGYSGGKEMYQAFDDYTDASCYKTDTDDTSFDFGYDYTGLSDSSFADITSFNYKCDSVNDVSSLLKFNKDYRNADGSVNVGNKCKIVDEKLLKFDNGKAIGANLSKTSDKEYVHYAQPNLLDCESMNDVRVQSVASVTECICNNSGIFQNFEVPARINGCDIEWESLNEDVITFSKEEKVSISNSIYKTAVVESPVEKTEVKVIATITCGASKVEKEFTLVVHPRSISLGQLTSNASQSIRVSKYSVFTNPSLYVLDSSSATTTKLSKSLYDISYSYAYAQDKNSPYYNVDGVYTSVPGVYKVTATAASKIVGEVGKTSSYTYYVYIVDPNCNIDFVDGNYNIQLNTKGFTITGDLSNIEGELAVVVTDTEQNLTAQQIIDNKDKQVFKISTDVLNANFLADNTSNTPYFAYFTVLNDNHSNASTATVYNFTSVIQEVSTTQQFYELATVGKLNGVSSTSTSIYSLTCDLDFSDFEWALNEKPQAFLGLFNGNDHTISNISIEESSANKNVNVFYKLSGTLMNTKFNNISLINTDGISGKQVGIIGDLQGGYVYNVRMTNITAKGKEGIGALVGQVTGKENYIELCSLINEDTCVIASSNKYAGGIVGNAQMNSDQTSYPFKIDVRNCYVKATIGDGKDSGGNTGGIIGRVKNDATTYSTIIRNCYYEGTIIAKGQYNAGILGDLDNGLGYIEIKNNLSIVVFIYDDVELDAYKMKEEGNTQKYAHKNSNPIIGRATKGETATYNCSGNIGTWADYYNTLCGVGSQSIVYELSNDGAWSLDVLALEEREFDLENTWTFDEKTLKLTLN